MGPTGTRGRTLAGVVTAVALIVPTLAFSGPPAGRAASAGGADLGLYGQPIRFEAADDGAIRFDGVAYPGVVEVRRAPSGELVVVNEVDMRTYVEGIAEMPPRWPMEALRAQAVAARTYAWHVAENNSYRPQGYDICDSTDCQVYRGLEVVRGPSGSRWRQAVSSTAGQVLTSEGQPILARYFSTSGGHTRDNEDVFPSEGPRPYLQGIEDPDDRVSPLHSWQASFTREQFDRLLAHGETLDATVPVADLQRLERPPEEGDAIRVEGRDGTTRVVSADALQDFLNDLAPRLFPARFPGPRSDGQQLPATVPSEQFTPRVGSGRVVLDGGGWGHGVGMGQYGAEGKARRGLEHPEILAAYYNGLEPTRPPEVPETVRVGLETTDGPVQLSAEEGGTVTVGDTRLARRAGSWQVRAAGSRTLGLSGPAAEQVPLVISPTTASRDEVSGSQAIRFAAVISRPTELVLEVTGPDGGRVARRGVGAVGEGRHSLAWSPTVDGSSLPPGRYEARLEAPGGRDPATGRPVSFEVVAPGGGEGGRGAAASGRGTWIVLAGLVLTGAAAGVAGALRVQSR